MRRFVATLAVVLCCTGSTPLYAQTTTPPPPPTEVSGLDALLRAIALLADLLEVLSNLGGTPPTEPPAVLCELKQDNPISLGAAPTFLPGDFSVFEDVPFPDDETIRSIVEPRLDAQGNFDVNSRCTFPGVRISSMDPNPPINPLGIRNPNGDARVDLLYVIQAFDTRMRGGCRPRNLAEIPDRVDFTTPTDGECRAFTTLTYRFNERPAVPSGGMAPPTETFDSQSQTVMYTVLRFDKELLGFLLSLICGGTLAASCLSGSQFPGLL